jgi:phage baseplate assembly protein gpV
MSLLNLAERYNDQQEALRRVLDGKQATIWTSQPGIVQQVDLVKLTVTLQPAIQAVVVQGSGRGNVTLPQIPDVPIVYPRGGGYSLTFPVGSGDECLAIHASRCIDNWWENGGIQPQYEQRMHDLSDCFALTGPYSQKQKIANVSTNTVQLRSDDGTLFVEVDLPNKKVRLISNADTITVDSNAGTISINATSTVEVTAPTTNVHGDLHVTGAVIAGFGGGAQVGLQTHHHVNDSHGDTEGPPVPGT